MASVSKKRKKSDFSQKGKGRDGFLSNRRSSRGAYGYNSSKRHNIKDQSRKEIETETSDLKHLESFSTFFK